MTNEQLRQLLCIYAMPFMNKPYRWGGDDPILGYDCSGLIQELLASIGCDPKGDQTAQGLYNIFRKYVIIAQGGGPFTEGDLLFFGKSTDEIIHIGMALNEFQMIEAGGGGRLVIDAESASKANAFVRVRPIEDRKDFVMRMTIDYDKFRLENKH